MVLVTYTIYLKNKKSKEFNYWYENKMSEQDINKFNYNILEKFKYLFKNQNGWEKIKVYMYFLMFMTTINDKEKFFDKTNSDSDLIKYFNVDLDNNKINNKPMNPCFDGQINLQLGFLNKDNIIFKLISLI
jgi:hypothetical protein